MVLMIAESAARFDYYLGIEPALLRSVLFSKDMFNDHMSFSAAHILDRFYFHHLLPSFHVLFNSFLVFPFAGKRQRELLNKPPPSETPLFIFKGKYII